MVMIYELRVSVSEDDASQQTDTFDHAIVADTNDNRARVLRRSLEDVSPAPGDARTAWPLRIQSMREVMSIVNKTRDEHEIHRMFPSQFNMNRVATALLRWG